MKLDRIRDAASFLSSERQRAAAAEEDLRQLIRVALADGTPVTWIAEAAGVSRQRVYQIRDGKR